MKIKVLGLLLLLIPIAASAQFAYNYTSGPILSVQVFGNYAGPTPPLGTDVTGVITLAQPLPDNGLEGAGTAPGDTPALSFNFQSGTGQSLINSNGQGNFGPCLCNGNGFAFTTTNSAITGFNFAAQSAPSPTLYESLTAEKIDGTSGDLRYVQTTASGGFTLDARAGSWTPKAVGAPEIDPTSGGAALTVLAGALVMLRGRRRRVR